MAKNLVDFDLLTYRTRFASKRPCFVTKKGYFITKKQRNASLIVKKTIWMASVTIMPKAGP